MTTSTRTPFYACFANFLREQGQESPNWFYQAPLILWVLFVTWGSLTPPDYLPHFTWNWADKIEHSSGYGVLAILFLRAWVRETRPYFGAVVKVWLICFAWGAYLEVMQSFTPQRTMDWRDAVANGIGAAGGLTLWLIAGLVARLLFPHAVPAPPPVSEVNVQPEVASERP